MVKWLKSCFGSCYSPSGANVPSAGVNGDSVVSKSALSVSLASGVYSGFKCAWDDGLPALPHVCEGEKFPALGKLLHLASHKRKVER